MTVGIIGGGIIGLGIGWKLLREGADVILFERDQVGGAASYVGAGMLAPYAEVGFEEIELMKLGQESLSMYPEFLQQLSEDVEEVPQLDRCGTLMVGVDRDDTEHLRRLYEFRDELALPVEMITGSEAREKEPLLSPRVVSAIWLPEDAQIDNRMLVTALKKAFINRGGKLYEHTEVQRVDIAGEKVKGVSTSDSKFDVDTLVLAAGCWSASIDGIPEEIRPPVRPVKGQILTLAKDPDYDLSCMVRSPRVYLVPKENREIRLGATSEEKGFDTEPTAGGMKELLEDGWEIAPYIYELPVREVLAGLRPGSRDHAPIIGRTEIDGLYYATGHYRHGILLAPVTVNTVVEEIMHQTVPEIIQNFRPERFVKKHTQK